MFSSTLGCLSCHVTSMQGLHEVLAELERAHLEYHKSEHRPMLYAASPTTQRAYALVEGTYQDVGALPGHPATFRISKVHHILSIQVSDGDSKPLNMLPHQSFNLKFLMQQLFHATTTSVKKNACNQLKHIHACSVYSFLLNHTSTAV